MKRNGQFLIAFILLIVLAALALAFLFLMPGRERTVTSERDKAQSIYVAEAGLHKAVWYLNTPVSQGGRGPLWRTTGLSETFSTGNYQMKVEDTAQPFEILITSKGTVRGTERTITQVFRAGLPDAFDYAVFSDSNLSMGGSSFVSGNLYADGNVVINDPASVTNGDVYVTPGYTVSGDGRYNEGTLEATTEMPTFNSSYYDQQIAIAQSQPAGNRTFTDFNLNGQTYYVNGEVILKGVITGPGAIVATGTIKVQTTDTAVLTANITLISKTIIQCVGTSAIGQGSLLFAKSQVILGGTSSVTGTILTQGTLSMSGTTVVRGIAFANTINNSGSAAVQGSFVSNSFALISGSVSFTYAPTYLPETPPLGMEPGDYVPKAGTWREI